MHDVFMLSRNFVRMSSFIGAADSWCEVYLKSEKRWVCTYKIMSHLASNCLLMVLRAAVVTAVFLSVS